MSLVFKSVFFLVFAAFAMQVAAQQPLPDGKSVAEKELTEERRTNAPVAVQADRQKVEPAGRFNPSEKLRADDAVSFPVDI